MAGRKNKSSSKAAKNPNGRTYYLGFPVSSSDLQNDRLLVDLQVAILASHGLVNPHQVTEDGVARPIIDGRPIADWPAKEEALGAIVAWKPTGHHLETDDGMDDEYVWARRGVEGQLIIKRQSKVTAADLTGEEAIWPKLSSDSLDQEIEMERPTGKKAKGIAKGTAGDEQTNPDSVSDDGTISMLSDGGSAITAALDENGNILNIATWEALNPPPTKKLSRVVRVVSKAKSVRRARAGLIGEELEAFDRAHFSLSTPSQEQRPVEGRKIAQAEQRWTAPGRNQMAGQPNFSLTGEAAQATLGFTGAESGLSIPSEEQPHAKRRKMAPKPPTDRPQQEQPGNSDDDSLVVLEKAPARKRASPQKTLLDSERQFMLKTWQSKLSRPFQVGVPDADDERLPSDGLPSPDRSMWRDQDWFDKVADPDTVAALAARSKRARRATLDAFSSLSSPGARLAEKSEDEDVEMLDVDSAIAAAPTKQERPKKPLQPAQGFTIAEQKLPLALTLVDARRASRSSVAHPTARAFSFTNTTSRDYSTLPASAAIPPFQLPKGMMGTNPLLDQLVLQSQADAAIKFSGDNAHPNPASVPPFQIPEEMRGKNPLLDQLVLQSQADAAMGGAVGGRSPRGLATMNADLEGHMVRKPT